MDEWIGRLSFRRREGRVDREGQARVCTRSRAKKARVRSRGFKLTGPDRMSAALRGRHVSHTRAKNTYTLERTKRGRGFYSTCPWTALGWHTAALCSPMLWSKGIENFQLEAILFLFVREEFLYGRSQSIVSGRKDFIFLIIFFFFYVLIVVFKVWGRDVADFVKVNYLNRIGKINSFKDFWDTMVASPRLCAVSGDFDACRGASF